ncbi:hypothetical protein BDV36DRAFT_280766 [Aspergillus pseudocaelatus]|uniref:Uncharacterized protein n=1 Tax=Aspergillus pseudocaelatus TaxID=1825620 RepID=A0ABQ6WYQ5_9EURO|nr:hypothetical protein BDV36DRAFT_280766 [Aspergillus pseudocaelatus]
MGLTESKIVLGKLYTACLEANSQGHQNIQGLFSDDEFISLLNGLWKQLPASTKARIRKTDNAISRKSATSSNIDISSMLKDCLPRWKDDLNTFFTDEDSLAIDINRPIAGSYNYLLQLEKRAEKDIWRSRFFKVVFHRLLQETCGTHKRSAGVQRAVTLIEKSGVVSDNREEIGVHCTAWGSTGRRLELLCKDLQKMRNEDGHNQVNEDDRNVEDDECNREYLGFLFRLPEYMTDD